MVASSTETLLDRTFETPELGRRETFACVVDQVSRGHRAAALVTIVAEVMANAARHGSTERLRVRGRRRGPLTMLAFDHDPPLPESALAALRRAGGGWLPDPEDLPVGGLGSPLLHSLSRRLTITPDGTCLRVWVATDQGSASTT